MIPAGRDDPYCEELDYLLSPEGGLASVPSRGIVGKRRLSQMRVLMLWLMISD